MWKKTSAGIYKGNEHSRNWKQKYNEKLTKGTNLQKNEDNETELTTIEEWSVIKIFFVFLNNGTYELFHHTPVKIDSAAQWQKVELSILLPFGLYQEN